MKRTITGVFICVLVYATLYFSSNTVFLHWVTWTISVLCIYEIFRAAELTKNMCVTFSAIIFSAVINILPIPYFAHILSFILIVAIIFYALMMYNQKPFRNYKTELAVGSSVVIVFFFRVILDLRLLKNGGIYLFFCATVCFVSDVMAYLCGKAFGKHKLYSSVSPNKTVEGSVFGILSATFSLIICGVLLERMTGFRPIYPLLILYTICAAAIGEFGDLAMSVTKRIYCIKDFGKCLPGHGGILDRFDSHIFSLAYTYIFCIFTGGYIM